MKFTLPLPPNMGNYRGHWTPERIATLRAWYADRADRPLELAKLAAILGRSRTVVCRKARELGLSNPRRQRGRKPRAKYATDAERRAAVGRATKERIATKGHPRGAAGLKHTPEHLAKMHNGAQRWQQSASAKEKSAVIDKQHTTKLARYGRLGMVGGSNPYSRCKHGRRPDLGNAFFRSRWEANYARYLNLLIAQRLIAKWEYEEDTFWFEAIRRGVRSYTPDFKVTEHNGAVYYVEVKGWMDAKSKTKIRRMAKYHPKVDLRVVGDKAYREIERKLGGAIPHWEAA